MKWRRQHETTSMETACGRSSDGRSINSIGRSGNRSFADPVKDKNAGRVYQYLFGVIVQPEIHVQRQIYIQRKIHIQREVYIQCWCK